MYFSINPGIVLQLVSVVISISMIVYFLSKGKRNAHLYSYLWCQSLIFIWSIGQIAEMSLSGHRKIWAAVAFEHIAICFIGVAWLIFSLFYTRSRIAKLKPLLFILVSPSIVFYSVLLTNEYHHLYYTTFESGARTYGDIFWLHVLFSYIFVIAGTVNMLRYSIRKPGNARKQSLILVLAALLPLAANVIMIIKIFFNRVIFDVDFDITPVSFSISLLLFALATFKYRFLNIFPMATKRIIDSMSEAVIVVDRYNYVTYFNKAFSEVFKSKINLHEFERISNLVHELKARVENTNKSEAVFDAIAYGNKGFVTGEFSIVNPERAYFSVRIQPIYDKRSEFLGRIISFNEITEYKQLLHELDEKNSELSAMNEQLKEYADAVEELTITKERNRFARDVHDTLGHSMTLLISLIEVCKITCKSDVSATGEKLEIAANAAKEGLRELRRSIRGLTPEKLKTGNLVESIKQVISDFGSSGVEVDFTAEGQEPVVSDKTSDAIFRVCQEALTNSVRHGKAQHVTIMLRFEKDCIRLFILDDGCGCKEITKGFGLTGMEARVNSAGGSLIYGSDGEQGFNIRVEIPLGV